MKRGASVELSIRVPLTVKTMAGAFTQLAHDEMAEFFVEVSRLTDAWQPGGRVMQMHSVGRYLRDQSGTDDAGFTVDEAIGARHLLRDIVDAADEVA